MEEIIAWGLGLFLGIACQRPFGSRVRTIFVINLVVALGTGVTVLSGEWAQNPAFALVDVGQVALAASIASFGRSYLIQAFSRALVLVARS